MRVSVSGQLEGEPAVAIIGCEFTIEDRDTESAPGIQHRWMEQVAIFRFREGI